jgi:sigma-E factor negative regulatory protein RseA
MSLNHQPPTSNHRQSAVSNHSVNFKTGRSDAMTSMKSPTTYFEQLSAMADGELDRQELSLALLSCGQDEAMLTSWSTYHLIGDALRSPAQVVPASDLAFLGRLKQRLAQAESAPLAPPEQLPKLVPKAKETSFPEVAYQAESAANDGVFRWKLLAGLASASTVFAIAWTVAGHSSSLNAPQLAQDGAAQQVVVDSPQGPVVRDAGLEELMAAHRQLGAPSALQAPSGFLRSASFETASGVRH